jgi:large subunit ribosomal protein L25
LHVEQENPVLVNARIPTVKAEPVEAAVAAPAAVADAAKEKDAKA